MQYQVTVTGRGRDAEVLSFEVGPSRRDPFGWVAMQAAQVVRPKPGNIVYPKGEQLGTVRAFGVYKARAKTQPISAKLTLTIEVR